MIKLIGYDCIEKFVVIYSRKSDNFIILSQYTLWTFTKFLSLLNVKFIELL